MADELLETYVRQLIETHAGVPVVTNGTKLDRDWAAFFKEQDFLVGISIDGSPSLCRLRRGPKASFLKVNDPLSAAPPSGAGETVCFCGMSARFARREMATSTR